MGVAEKSDDSAFKREHDMYHGTVASVHALKKAMTDHSEAMRRALSTASALSLQLAAFHRGSEKSESVELGKIFAETEVTRALTSGCSTRQCSLFFGDFGGRERY